MAHSDTLTKVIEATVTLKTLSPVKQVAAIKDKFLPVLEKRVKETTGDIRKGFSQAYNEFASIRDGINSGDVTRKDMEQLVANLQTIRQQVARAETLDKKPKRTAEEIAIADMISDSGPGIDDRLQTQGAVVLKKYAKYETMVPKRTKSRVMDAIKMPIVAVTDPVLYQPKLHRFKLCDDTIFGYPILLRQTLIGLNNDWVAKEYKFNTKPAIDEVLETLRDKTNVKYMQLGVPNVRSQVTWVWVATEREMAALNNSAGGGHFRVTGWDFTFEVEKKWIRAKLPKEDKK